MKPEHERALAELRAGLAIEARAFANKREQLEALDAALAELEPLPPPPVLRYATVTRAEYEREGAAVYARLEAEGFAGFKVAGESGQAVMSVAWRLPPLECDCGCTRCCASARERAGREPGR